MTLNDYFVSLQLLYEQIVKETGSYTTMITIVGDSLDEYLDEKGFTDEEGEDE